MAKIVAKRWGRDNSWAIFVDNCLFISGLAKHEVAYYKNCARVMRANSQ